MEQLNKHEEKLFISLEIAKQLSEINAKNGWKLSNEDKNEGFTNHTTIDQNLQQGLTRGEGTLDIPIKILEDILNDPTSRPKFVKQMKHAELLQKTPKGFNISYFINSAPLGYDRDVLTISGIVKENGIAYFIATSIKDDQLKPEEQGYVRAETHYSLYIMTSKGESQTHVVIISCIDPKGMIPGFIKNKMLSSRGIEALKNIRDYAKTLL